MDSKAIIIIDLYVCYQSLFCATQNYVLFHCYPMTLMMMVINWSIVYGRFKVPSNLCFYLNWATHSHITYSVKFLLFSKRVFIFCSQTTLTTTTVTTSAAPTTTRNQHQFCILILSKHTTPTTVDDYFVFCCFMQTNFLRWIFALNIFPVRCTKPLLLCTSPSTPESVHRTTFKQ